jgi:large conductance mechanosensitive channel
MLKEFREFAMRGNVVDMAVGIIIGGAFGTIVKSLVDDIIMPPVGMLLGEVDFSQLFVVLSGERMATIEQTVAAGGVTLNIGLFVNAVIAFAIVAFALFLVVRAMNRLRAAMEEPEAPGAPAAPPRQEALLEEIRDLLKARTS